MQKQTARTQCLSTSAHECFSISRKINGSYSLFWKLFQLFRHLLNKWRKVFKKLSVLTLWPKYFGRICNNQITTLPSHKTLLTCKQKNYRLYLTYHNMYIFLCPTYEASWVDIAVVTVFILLFIYRVTFFWYNTSTKFENATK